MKATGVDVLISAPQKGWSSSPCCAMVMLSERARAAIDATTSSSFACDLKKWLQIMEAYEGGGHAYHATHAHRCADAPARHDEGDAGLRLRQGAAPSRKSWAARCARCSRAAAFASVAADGFKAPGVVVSYTTDPDIQSSRKFLAEGLQTAAGVPLQCDEGADFKTFRVGLFGLEKWHHVDRTVAQLAAALDRIGVGTAPAKPQAQPATA